MKFFEITKRGIRIAKFGIGWRFAYHAETGKFAGFYVWVDWLGGNNRTWR